MRHTYIDRARGIAILIVVYIHLAALSGGTDPFVPFLSSFALTVFPMFSGYLRFLRGSSGRFFPFLKRKFFSLLLPYFSFSLATLLIEAFRSFRTGGSLVSAKETVLHILPASLSLTGFGPEWFLPALFFAEVFFYPVGRILCDDAGAGNETGNRKGGFRAVRILLPVLSLLVSLVMLCCPVDGFLTALWYFRYPLILGLVLQGFVTAGFLFLPRMLEVLKKPGHWPLPLPLFLLSQSRRVEDDAMRQVAACGRAGARINPSLLYCLPLLLSLFLLYLIYPRCYPDFRHLVFGRVPLLNYPAAMLGSFSMLWIGLALDNPGDVNPDRGNPDRIEEDEHEHEESKRGRALRNFLGAALAFCGKHSLLIMCTHLNWYLIHIVDGGYSALFQRADRFGIAYCFDMAAKLLLVMLMETGIISLRHVANGTSVPAPSSESKK